MFGRLNPMTHKKFAIILGSVIIAAFIFLLFGAKPNNNSKIAEVFSDGNLIRRIDLSAVTDEYEFTVDYNGRSNTVAVKHGSISVVASDCPDRICVHTGEIRDGSTPIVCLPNKLMIKIVGTADENIPDTVSR